MIKHTDIEELVERSVESSLKSGDLLTLLAKQITARVFKDLARLGYMLRRVIIEPGTQVFTTEPDHSQHEQWSKEAWEARKWQMYGRVVRHSDGHGLCYWVVFDDQTGAWYAPNEIIIVQ